MNKELLNLFNASKAARVDNRIPGLSLESASGLVTYGVINGIVNVGDPVTSEPMTPLQVEMVSEVVLKNMSVYQFIQMMDEIEAYDKAIEAEALRSLGDATNVLMNDVAVTVKSKFADLRDFVSSELKPKETEEEVVAPEEEALAGISAIAHIIELLAELEEERSEEESTPKTFAERFNDLADSFEEDEDEDYNEDCNCPYCSFDGEEEDEYYEEDFRTPAQKFEERFNDFADYAEEEPCTCEHCSGDYSEGEITANEMYEALQHLEDLLESLEFEVNEESAADALIKAAGVDTGLPTTIHSQENVRMSDALTDSERDLLKRAEELFKK